MRYAGRGDLEARPAGGAHRDRAAVEAGHAQILKIHSQKIENEFLAHDVDVADLAKRTKNFSGAEIEGLVKSAVSFALARQVDFQNLGAMDIGEDNVKIERADFERARRCGPRSAPAPTRSSAAG